MAYQSSTLLTDVDATLAQNDVDQTIISDYRTSTDQLEQWQVENSVNGMGVETLTTDQDGNVYVGGFDNVVHKYNSNGTLEWTFTEHTDRITQAVINSDYVYTASYDGTIRKIDIADGSEAWVHNNPNSNAQYTCLVVAGDFIYAGDSTQTVRKIAISDGTEYTADSWPSTGLPSKVTSITTIDTGTGALIVVGGDEDGAVQQLIDGTGPVDGTLQGTTIVHTQRINDITIDGNTGVTYTASDDNTIAKVVFEPDAEPSTLSQYNDSVNSLTLVDDGAAIISGIQDGTIRKIDSDGNQIWVINADGSGPLHQDVNSNFIYYAREASGVAGPYKLQLPYSVWTNKDHTLQQLSNVALGSPTNNQVLTYNDSTSQWENADASGGGASELSDLTDVDASSPTTGDALTFDGSNWTPTNITINSLDDISDVNTPTPSDGQALTWDNTNSDWIASSVVTTLDGLNDVNASSPSDGQALTWDNINSEWIAQSVGGATTLDGLDDVNASSPSDGQALTWDNTNSEWIASSVVTSLDGLNDVNASSPSDGQVLAWDSNNTEWTTLYHTVSTLNDTNVSAESAEDILYWDNSNNEWINSNITTLSDFQLSQLTDVNTSQLSEDSPAEIGNGIYSAYADNLADLIGWTDSDITSTAIGPFFGGVIVGTSSNTLVRYDNTGNPVWTSPANHTDVINAVYFEEGQTSYLYSVSDDGSVRKWNESDGTEVTTDNWPLTSAHSGQAVKSLTVDYSGGFIYTGGADNTVRKFDAGTGAEQTTDWPFTGHTATVNHLAFNSGGYILSAATSDVRRIEASNAAETWVTSLAPRTIDDFAYHGPNVVLVVGSDYVVRGLDTNNGDILKTISYNSGTGSSPARIASNGSTILTTTGDDILYATVVESSFTSLHITWAVTTSGVDILESRGSAVFYTEDSAVNSGVSELGGGSYPTPNLQWRVNTLPSPFNGVDGINKYTIINSDTVLTGLYAYAYNILADTEFGSITITLPPTANTGHVHRFVDPGTNWGTNNNLIIDGNGANVNGSPTYTADTDGGMFEVIFSGDAWIVRTLI